MAFIETTGKNVEDAVAKALKELNVTAEQVVVDVLEEGKKGFLFGIGSKDAKVRVTVKESPVEVEKEKTFSEAVTEAKEALKTVGAVAAEVIGKKAEELKADATEKLEEIKADATVKAEEIKAVADTKADELKAKFEEKKAEISEAISEEKKSEGKTKEARKYAVSDESVAAAKEFLQKVFNAMKIEVVMEKFINKNDGSVTFKLHGDDMGIMIGKHGQTLDSLQYLTNLVANKNSNERVRVIIDVEDYRDRRIETLTRLARRLADKVKRTGERVELEAMNPHERKIIHMALQGDRRVTTLSEGDEPYRHVVIELKK
ncbi:MAG: KH domain-containing protein [Phascolarctobacterium sp.]|nr:KH domain-containing protein [Phascolarctobacterium sp.]